MFDTVHVKVDRPLKPEIVKSLEDNKNVHRDDSWFIRLIPSLDSNRMYQSEVWATHPSTGITLRGHNGVVELVQASLPRVLFGDNGRLIRCPQQLEESQQRLTALLDEVTTARSILNEYVRADIVMHVRCDIPKFIAAHRHCRHPLIRNETDEYGARGLKLPGSKAAILFYDKQLEMGAGPGDILRVEIQLWKPKLGELLAEDKPLYSLSFWNAYRLYRSLMCKLQPVTVPEEITLNTLLASCEAADFKLPNGLSAMENYRATVRHDTYLARRRAVKGQILSAAGIDWSTLLPENSLPLDLPDAVNSLPALPIK